MSSEKEFKHESLQDRFSIVRYLNEIVNGLENGVLEFKTSKDTIQLNPKGLIQMGVRVKKKDEKVKMTLKLNWKEGNDNITFTEDSFVINSEK